MPVICTVEKCGKPAVLKRPKTEDALCKECFFFIFEIEIHLTIIRDELFKRGDKVAIGASGGKDSTVLAYVLKLLNDRYDYGLDLFLLSIDEGITGYRDDSLETVKQNRDDYQLPLKILSYKDLYGWTMDEIVAKIGKKNNCTFCGVFRRQALDRGAALIGADMIVTGHNADDMAETIIMNILRGDLARLTRCTNIITQGEGTIPRCKPLKYAYEKEIVMYAHYKQLVYFSTECMYAPNAFRGYTREYIKDLERIRPTCIIDIIHSGESVQVNKSIKFPQRRTCTRCGFVASQEICKACVLLEGLNIGQPKLGIGKSNKAKKIMGLKVPDGSENKSTKKLNNPQIRKESKRKMKRENKKQLSCREKCKPSCRSKKSEKQIIDIDIGDSFLSESNINFDDQETSCYLPIDQSKQSRTQDSSEESASYSTPVDCSESFMSELNLNEDVTNNIEDKKVLEDCIYPPMLQMSTKDELDQPNAISSNDHNIEESKLSTSDQYFEKAADCKAFVDCSESFMSKINLNDELTNEDQQEEKIVDCKCSPRLQENADVQSDQHNDSNIDYDEVINLKLLTKILMSDKPDLLALLTEAQSSKNEQASSSIANEWEYLDSMSIEDFFYIYELPPFTEEELKKSNLESFDFDSILESGDLESQLLENLDLDSNISSLTINESKNSEVNIIKKSANKSDVQPSASVVKQNELQVIKPLNVQTSKHTESPLTKSSDNLATSLDEQPNVVKAKPTRIKPSMILPEMMYKTKNNLEF